MKLIKSIKQQRMRVCNMSKLYGMMVYCSYKMGIEYNAHFYLNQMEYVIYHILHSEDENRFFLWDDDMFFYYFCSGLLEKSDNIEKAQEYFDQAKYHMFSRENRNQLTKFWKNVWNFAIKTVISIKKKHCLSNCTNNLLCLKKNMNLNWKK